MATSEIVFQSQEVISGRHVRSKEWINYKGLITISGARRYPVLIDLEFQGIQPSVIFLPTHKMIKAENLSQAFVKLFRFLKGYGIEMK